MMVGGLRGGGESFIRGGGGLGIGKWEMGRWDWEMGNGKDL